MFTRLRNVFGGSPSHKDVEELTPEQKRIYAEERAINYRSVARLCATRSSYTLTSADLASAALHVELAQLGQFAELAYADLARFNARFVFDNLDVLSGPGFPLEGYDALRDAKLVASVRGTVAQLHAIVCYRASTKQLIVGFQGTINLVQALYDLNIAKQPHPAGPGCAVHAGFWKMYQGLRAQVLESVQKALREHDVRELACVGHSMGGVLGHLFAVDVLSTEALLPWPGLVVAVASYGCPRFGNAALANRWQELIQAYRAVHGDGAVQEYTVRAFNDGVPCLPPSRFGFKHLTWIPLYFYHGRLFHVPGSEGEHGFFDVSKEALDATKIPDYPRGGHNYYSGRNWEGTARRVFRLEEMLQKHAKSWADKYAAYIARHDPKREARAETQPQ